jgi:6-carboxyhexanoate--CoA ligase
MTNQLNSLRMRAEKAGKHISGAERLVTIEQLEDAAVAMLERAMRHPRGQAERIHFSVQAVSSSNLQYGRLPDLHNNQVHDWQQGRELAGEILGSCGVAERAIESAMAALSDGAAPDGQSMRGAMLVDADSGERLEADPARGVRVSRMDLTSQARQQLVQVLQSQGLDNPHVLEALTLAAKVVAAPTMVAELCWSDDPDYLAGYVASASCGYQRINLMKPAAEERGGRAFFVRCSKERLGFLIDWLERQPFLLERVGRIHPVRQWRKEV